ncbi:HEPN domain-containing protein [Parachryseolinea silvisoli]|uniref:HEPN domain-containing protein n=1 Tax=Parachryseolinea silvisoli TaxID=2873601 RepID=UPI0022658354|nr:HEPN domain-containing protein [Parachryseolinea silvisoli]MCD9015249.1 HEPN domain-containing protein [Parachryseolinea silvisoli]
MKTSLDHLPEGKKQEILAIAEIIKEAFNPEKIILFGSYATDKWVEERYVENNIVYEYLSDYDFLVVTSERPLAEYILTNKVEQLCRGFRTPVNSIIHDIKYVNDGLAYGQYFFVDILREGVLLYDTGKSEFVEPKELTPAEKRAVAQEHYDEWFQSGARFLRFAEFGFRDALSRNEKLNDTAFQLHQAAERFYATILLVFTGYKPKLHHIKTLRKLSKPLSRSLYRLFCNPPDDKQESRIFDLLVRGYVEARYKRDYFITEEEAKTLIERIRQMEDIVQTASLKKIESYR